MHWQLHLLSIYVYVCISDTGINLMRTYPLNSVLTMMPVMFVPCGALGSMHAMLIGAPFSLTVLPLLAANAVAGSAPVSSATAPSVVIPMPDVLIQSVAVVNASSSIVYLGTEDGQVIEYDIDEDDEVRTWDLTSVLKAERNLLEGLVFVPSSANSDGGTFWMSDALALYEVRKHSSFTVALSPALTLCVFMVALTSQVRLRVQSSSSKITLLKSLRVGVDIATDIAPGYVVMFRHLQD
jgi:hypothetical protein